MASPESPLRPEPSGGIDSSSFRLSIDATALANPRRTGIGRVLESLLPELLALAPPDSRIRLFAGGRITGAAAELIRRDPRLESETAFFPSLYTWQQLGMGRAIGRFRPHTHLAPEGLLPLGLEVPAVGIVHDLLWHRHPETCKAHVRAVYRWRFRSSLRRLRSVQYDSLFTQNEVRNAYPGAEPRSARVVPLGVCSKAFHPPDGEDLARGRDFLEAERLRPPYLLAVGNLRPHKNLTLLLHALLHLQKSGRNTPALALVGAGELPSEARQLLGDLPEDGVRTLGYLDESSLRLAYQQARAFVFPSLYEGFGLPLLEAMASGLPVAYARAGALPEVAGGAAIGFDPSRPEDLAEIIDRLISDETLHQRLARAGIERARTFSWRKTAEALWDTLDRAARGAA